jgi:hypothetical protein
MSTPRQEKATLDREVNLIGWNPSSFGHLQDVHGSLRSTWHG